MDIPNNEQWKLDGKCAICRRANYCTNDCSAFKKRKERIFRSALNDVLSEQLNKETKKD